MQSLIKNLSSQARKDALRSLSLETLRGLARLCGLPQSGSKAAMIERLEACPDIVIHAEARIGIKAPGDDKLVSGENPSLEHYRQQQAWIEQVEIVETEIPVSRPKIKRN